jgi:phage anti-repressor protein
MAKELAMLENNAKGKETRKYFLSVEKEYQKGFETHFTSFIKGFIASIILSLTLAFI